jgi:peptidoglycan/xylan/chitin deacetylase (PgdA/CDA1 family)
MPQRYGTKKDIREILLTFDDGPNPKTTRRLLDVLAANGVKAVFFVLGERIAGPEGRRIVERAHQDGHQIGNHSFSHLDLKTLTEDEVKEEIRKTDELIGSCADPCKLFRPPYGSTNQAVGKCLQESGCTTLLWNVDTLDWHQKYKKDGAWVDHAMEQIRAREDSIVLMHDIHATTVDYVDGLIKRIKRLSNVEFVQYA